MKPIYYVYPKWHTVSFTLVARKHVEYLKKLRKFNVYEIDELLFPTFTPVNKAATLIHPAFFVIHKVLQKKVDLRGVFRKEYYDWWRKHFGEFIGFEVCDSDRISKFAVALANLLDKIIVPSSFCRKVFKKSNVKIPVYRVPHGVDPEWYTKPNVWESVPPASLNPSILHVYLHKIRKNKKVILFWLWHSGDRKGWPEVREVYHKLASERKDVLLVIKSYHANIPEFQQVMNLGAVNVYGWLSDLEKMALYDLADIVLNFSRGGGFELNCLEALARGVPCVASDYGSWTDYVPKFLQVKRGYRVVPLPNNKIHVGYGYTVNVESALDKIHDILNNLDEYKAKVDEYRKKVLRRKFRWDLVAKKIAKIIEGQ